MTRGSSGLQRWTKRFTVTAAGGFVASLLAEPILGDARTGVLIGVFGFVCPMIFGMAYLLLPPYVGRTLVDDRLPGIHFVLASLGAGLMVGGWILEGNGAVFSVGAVVWTGGVAIFLGSLLATIGPELATRPGDVLRGRDYPQRSTGIATATIPVAIGYLVVGTVALLVAGPFVRTGVLSDTVTVTIPDVVHYHLLGFGTLLIFALGVRLLIGFFHIDPPRPLAWLVLGTGVLAPAMLGAALWRNPWFRIGAVLEGIAMTGYLLLVVIVAVRADRRRPGFYGILLGALAGLTAVGAAVPLAFGVTDSRLFAVHRTLVLGGFFPLTIVGYAYQFFPVTIRGFLGTDVDHARVTVGLLGVGVTRRALGLAVPSPTVHLAGIAGSLLGALGYAALMLRRFSG